MNATAGCICSTVPSNCCRGYRPARKQRAGARDRCAARVPSLRSTPFSCCTTICASGQGYRCGSTLGCAAAVDMIQIGRRAQRSSAPSDPVAPHMWRSCRTRCLQ
eukprot:2521688-Prymnesium_polylepis.1